mmetsp:Transcript_46972/g.152674  ORF Transcript_46972/g.152674 Transcript_46972/m.152674 type:complete len:588 (-) Transcript_46972:212-1975(-)
MTKTPNLNASRRFRLGRKQPLTSKRLTEPFLSPGGSVHTTEGIEKSKLRVRWLVLALLSLLMSGNYYCYDNPAALYTPLARRFVTNRQFELYFDGFYSIYSLPNIVLPLIGGVIVDRWGFATSLCLFTSFCLAGQAAVAAACASGSLNGMLVGRAIFGLGGESLSVAQSAFITSWFHDKELALSLGLSLSVARLGSVVNNLMSPRLASAFGSVHAALWAGAAFLALSLLCALALRCIDGRCSRAIRARFRIEAESSAADGPVSLSAVRRFGRPFWCLAACCVAVYASVLPFNNVSSALLFQRDFFRPGSVWTDDKDGRDWVYDPLHHGRSWPSKHPPGVHCSEARARDEPFCRAIAEAMAKSNEVMSEPFSVSAVLTPLLGWRVDRSGGRATLCVWSAVAVALVHLALAVTALPASLLLLGLGAGYCVFASVIWPSVPFVVDSKALGTAYGVITSLQNLGLCLVPMAVAYVHPLTRDWRAPGLPLSEWSGVELFFSALGAVGILAGLALGCDPLVRAALNSPTGRLPTGARIFVQDGWERSPDLPRPPSPPAVPATDAVFAHRPARTTICLPLQPAGKASGASAVSP